MLLILTGAKDRPTPLTVALPIVSSDRAGQAPWHRLYCEHIGHRDGATTTRVIRLETCLLLGLTDSGSGEDPFRCLVEFRRMQGFSCGLLLQDGSVRIPSASS